ncbi:MAG TPA: D-aminoacyl-tRNA deacylase [Dehalococcoidia bacterium]|nr:D-aminoacyl-tRNA deacylase [Dehalococcoidia bacterium]
MRLVIQRVRQAKVRVQEETVAEIGRGLLVLVGVAQGDSAEEAQGLAKKTAELRIFADDEGRFNRSLLETGGEALVVSQFTLLADARKGRRPNFIAAAAPEVAEPLVLAFADALREAGVPTQTGRFGAMMQVELTNDGPVTLVLDSRD